MRIRPVAVLAAVLPALSIAAGCAGGAAPRPPQAGTAVPAAAAPPAKTVARTAPADPATPTLAAMVKQGYKLIDEHGQKLYCRTDNVTGSHVQTRTTCLTEREADDLASSTRTFLDHTILTGAPPAGK